MLLKRSIFVGENFVKVGFKEKELGNDFYDAFVELDVNESGRVKKDDSVKKVRKG